MPSKRTGIYLGLAIFAIVFLSLLDIGFNLIGVLAPSIGAAFETLSETIIEVIQLIAIAVALFFTRRLG